MTGHTRVLDARDLDAAALLELYAAPDGSWVRTNFVTSIDGAAVLDGSSSGLTNTLDQHVLKLLRGLADVVLVGGATIRAEDYIGVRVTDSAQQHWRQEHGMAPVPPIAVVTGRADIDPESRLFTHTIVPPIILTTAAANATAKADLAAAGGEVIELGSDSITSASIIGALADRGLTRITCEGGPTLAGQLITDGVLDELDVTTAPVMTSGPAVRMSHSPCANATRMRCSHIILDSDGTQIARWVRDR